MVGVVTWQGVGTWYEGLMGQGVVVMMWQWVVMWQEVVMGQGWLMGQGVLMRQ